MSFTPCGNVFRFLEAQKTSKKKMASKARAHERLLFVALPPQHNLYEVRECRRRERRTFRQNMVKIPYLTRFAKLVNLGLENFLEIS